MSVDKVKIYSVPLKKMCIEQFERRGVHVPPDAKSCKTFSVENENSVVSTYSFYDKEKRLKKRVKRTTDYETRETTDQIRYYEYSDKKNKTQLDGVSQYQFDSKRRCVSGEHWHFYYPKFEKTVRFAQKGSSGEKNNFIHSPGVIIDDNGIKIRPVSIAEYLENKRQLGKNNFVDAPWTVSESITRESAATDRIAECTVVGIIGKKGISLNHFSPASPENQKFSTIEKKLTEELKEQGENPKVFLVGSCESDSGSNVQFNAIDDFFTKNNVPHSKYKTGDKVLYEKMPRLTYFNRYNFLSFFGIYNHNSAHSYLYGRTGQHILYKNGEIMLTNPIIDRELIKGNNDAEDLIRKSFQYIDE